MAVSPPRSESQSMRGARGEAHANECPGAMIPALPALASRPSASFSSRIVTSCPALARKYAVVTPTTPPPSTRVLMGSRLEEEARPQGIAGIEEELAEAREVGRAGDLWQDRAAALDHGLAGDAAREVEAQKAPAGDARAHAHEALVMEERHARAGARPAGRSVDLTRAPHERVRRHAGAVRQFVHEDVVDTRLAEPGHAHLELGVDGLAHRHAPLRDAPGLLAPHGHAELRRLDDREDVADTERHVDRDLAHRLDLDALPGEHDEGWSPAERHLAHAIAVDARDGLDDAGLRVDDHRGLGAEPADHPGLDGDRRRADRAFPARDVVATGIDEEEAEVGARRDRVGHHRNQEASVSARLEAEPGPKILVMLLEEAPLLADRGARELAEPAREQAHPDARRMEVDGRDDAIGPHGHLTLLARSYRTSGRRAPRSRPARARGPPPREPRPRCPRRRRARPPHRTPGCGRRAVPRSRRSSRPPPRRRSRAGPGAAPSRAPPQARRRADRAAPDRRAAPARCGRPRRPDRSRGHLRSSPSRGPAAARARRAARACRTAAATGPGA